MATCVLIPQAFENMEEATIGEWLKSETEAVAEGDPLCELITEKTTFPLESPGSGTLLKIHAPAKSVVPVGYCIAILGTVGEPLPEVEASNRELLASRPTSGVEELPVVWVLEESTPAAQSGSGSRVRATPAARRAARERGVDLAEVAATATNPVVTEEDVLAFAGRSRPS